jgi:hypothetical protein
VRAAPGEARPPHEHERRLKAFVTHLLGEAALKGFSLDEVLTELRTHQQKEPDR